jgi:hypothetical protein
MAVVGPEWLLSPAASWLCAEKRHADRPAGSCMSRRVG